MNKQINGLHFRKLKQSIETYENKGYSYIHLNAIYKDYQVLDCKKVSPIEYVAHLRDTDNKENYLVGLSSNRYHIIKRWKNDIQR